MDYVLSQNVMKVITEAQVKALASLDGWRADRITVNVDFKVDTPATQHGKGTALVACVYRYKEAGDRFPVFVCGVMPNGDMHS
jgi:hypothetical protein